MTDDIPAHHLNTCVQCRDWGKYELHEDHWPTAKPAGDAK